jgi:hypothetical protein
MMYDPLALGIGKLTQLQHLHIHCKLELVLCTTFGPRQQHMCPGAGADLLPLPVPVAATILAELPYVIAQATVFVPIVSGHPRHLEEVQH